MNTVPFKTSMASRIYPQWREICNLQNVAQNSSRQFEAAGTKKKSARSPAAVYALLFLHDVVWQSEIAEPKRSVQVMMQRARAQEKLICEAETTLASQTARTYRQWYSHWRRCGVRVDDLLDMTWVWRQRARIL